MARTSRHGGARDGKYAPGMTRTTFGTRRKRGLIRSEDQIREGWDDVFMSPHDRGRVRRQADRVAIQLGYEEWLDLIYEVIELLEQWEDYID